MTNAEFQAIRARSQMYLTHCLSCGANTSKKYAREHQGQCKTCFTGVEQPYRGPKCPQCDAPISSYKAAHHYVCEGCCRQNDPEGYIREVYEA